MSDAVAYLGGLWGTDLDLVTDDLDALGTSGRWAVAVPFAGDPVLARFRRWSEAAPDGAVGPWRGPAASDWHSSMTHAGYCDAVERVRTAIAAGTVYQANVCRVLSARLPEPALGDVAGLMRLLQLGNPAPYAGMLRLPKHDVAIACASPELYLSVSADRVAASGPIKGTGRTANDLSAKDAAENVMIVDLVRNDLSRVSEPGTVSVPSLLTVEEHPGLVHLVSRVQAALRRDTTWAAIFDATFPPGSVSGAPKLSALQVIASLEPVPRSFYCGAFGWVDADEGTAELAVAIRTFWIKDGQLNFGTGAGITWDSDAQAEWRETELKASRLVGIAAQSWPIGEHRPTTEQRPTKEHA